jgi:LuxR family maltose regulon positive regulatory protein
MPGFALTKLVPLRPCDDVMPRPHLHAALSRAIGARALTLISAPAGYGKTTLLAEDAAARRHAWLTLDENDNDPSRFLAALVAALERLDRRCGAAAAALEAGAQAWSDPVLRARQVVAALVNDLLEPAPHPFVLALDDLHLVVEPAVHVALECLVERMPPHMRLVIATRHDPPLPLARWRARGQLAELRLTDLRFTRLETEQFVNGQLGLGLGPNELDALNARAEGWPAGLRLLAASLGSMPASSDRAAFIEQLARSDRRLFDFLASEVLDRQPLEVREFLLRTSILDELEPEACRAVAGCEDADRLLDALRRRNLLVAAGPDAPRPVLRYHDLFSAFLRRMLERDKPDQLAELHQRAAEAQADPERRIAHYLSAHLWESAAAAIKQCGGWALAQGRLQQLEGWLRALPEAWADDADLVVLRAASAMQRGEIGRAQGWLERVMQRRSATGCGEAVTLMAGCAFLDGDLARAAILAEEALATPLPAWMRPQPHLIRAWHAVFEGAWDRAAASLGLALAAVETTEAPEGWLALAFYLDPGFLMLPGMLPRLERFCQQSQARFGDAPGLLRVAVGEIACFISLLRGQMEEAERAARGALAVLERLGSHPLAGQSALACLAFVATARGRHDEAGQHLDALLARMAWPRLHETWLAAALHLQAKNACARGMLDQARACFQRMRQAWPGLALPEMRMLLPLTRGLIAAREGRAAQAEVDLLEAAALEDGVPIARLYTHARLALASFYQANGRPVDALAQLEPALAECERYGMPGLVLKEGALAAPALRLAAASGMRVGQANALIAALAPACSLAGAPGASALSPRELEILRLVAAGHSNRAIAGQLSITERTVKAHVSSILRKLDAASRVQAVARAMALRIL